MKHTKFLGKIIPAVLLIAMFLSVVLDLSAQDGGYQGPRPRPETANLVLITVGEAKTLNNKAWVLLRGKIESSLGHEDYVFADASGSVNIDIDDEDWRGLFVNENDVVEIVGKVKKASSGKNIEIDVRTIKKL
ncbi:hypothetical protein AGMMS49940_20940 [Spirochaetia bacterium]|nr:hypothetical protein AGMMS49940_20940 [Spirochaetia bacterium]